MTPLTPGMLIANTTAAGRRRLSSAAAGETTSGEATSGSRSIRLLPATCPARRFPGNVQFAASSQGWSDIVIDGTFSIARYIAERNGHNAEPELRLSLAVETQHNVAGHIDEGKPWQVVYPGAWDSADLRLGIWQGKAARIEKVVDIHSMPSGDSEFVEYSFLIRSSHARVLAGPNFDISPWHGRHAELFDAQAFVCQS
jgi:hypothetical protein